MKTCLYDPIGQLKIADSSVNTEDRGYKYDAAWNLNWLTNNGAASQFTVDTRNELTNWTDGPCYYDANGNLTNKASDTFGDFNVYAYDDENRLIDVQNLSVAYETVFVYDGLGRLRIRQEYQGPPTMIPVGSASALSGPTAGLPLVNEVHYIYDGMRVIQERNSNNVPVVSYTRGTDLSASLEGAGGIGGLLARSSGYSSGNWTNHACYHADGNGNITAMIDSGQNTVANYRYDPFGNTISSSGTLATTNVYRFSSKECHVNSGMYYYLYRFYDPSVQRWINRDPIGDTGFQAGRAIARKSHPADIAADPSTYLFAQNDPVITIDADGQWVSQWPAKLVATCLQIAGPVGRACCCLHAQTVCLNDCESEYGAAAPPGEDDPAGRAACRKDCLQKASMCMGRTIKPPKPPTPVGNSQ